MAIYKLLLANYHSRKHVTSHIIVMSKSPVMKTIAWIILCICNLQLCIYLFMLEFIVCALVFIAYDYVLY